MNKQELVTYAKRVVDERRMIALSRRDKLLEQLRTHEDWCHCENQLKNAQVDWALYGKDSAKKEIDRQKAIRDKLLKKYNLTPNDLLPHYFCAKCNDSGSVNGKMCNCLQNEIRKLLVSQSNVANSLFTFENNCETNKHNLEVFKKARQVCDGKWQNMLLLGNTGTGKTYLLAACVNLCTSMGKSVLFTTAYNLGALLLECYLSDEATKRTIFNNLIDVDVLAIDDLGTENVYKNVTAEYLFALLNERMSLKKQTYVNSNLSIGDIRERYDERIFSRLVDQRITFVAELVGEDKRLAKKQGK